MSYDFTKNDVFDPDDFIESLIDEMGLKDAEPEQKETLRQLIGNQVTELIINTASLHMDPDLVEAVAEKFPKEAEDPVYFTRMLIQYSPEAQMAIAEALDTFYDEQMEDFHFITKK